MSFAAGGKAQVTAAAPEDREREAHVPAQLERSKRDGCLGRLHAAPGPTIAVPCQQNSCPTCLVEQRRCPSFMLLIWCMHIMQARVMVAGTGGCYHASSSFKIRAIRDNKNWVHASGRIKAEQRVCSNSRRQVEAALITGTFQSRRRGPTYSACMSLLDLMRVRAPWPACPQPLFPLNRLARCLKCAIQEVERSLLCTYACLAL